jgi:hypothetical protein
MLVVLLEIIRCEGSFVSQCMQRLTAPDGTKGPLAPSFRPVPSQKQWSSMHMVTLGAFGVRPPACVPNSIPSQARFKESTLMSRSCDLFCEGPRKRHPHALGLDELF